MAYAELYDGRIVVQTEWVEKDLVKMVPGTRWDSRGRVWEASLSWSVCLALRGVFGQNLHVGPQLRDWSWIERNYRVDPTLQLRNLLTTNTPDDPLPDGSSLYGFQRAGRDFLLTAGDACIGDDMGTGKTVQTLAALRRLYLLDHQALPAIVVCPNSVKGHWEKHVKKWFPEATPYALVGSAAKRRKALEEAKHDPSAIVIVNIEGVRLLSRLAPYGNVNLTKCRQCDRRSGDPQLTVSRCEIHPKELNGFGFTSCVLDEAHRVKEPTAKQTRAIWAVFHDPSVIRRWGLTGTLISDHPGDLWSIMHALAPYEYPVKSKYVDRYCYTSWNVHGGMEIVGLQVETRDEFFRFFDPRFRRMTKDLVLPQLPPKRRTSRSVTMSSKQAKAYRDVERDLVTTLEDGSVMVARSNLSAQTRLLQFASSYCKVDEIQCRKCNGVGYLESGLECSTCRETGIEWLVTLQEPSPKLDALMEILEENAGRPMAVVAEHRQLIELAAARLEAKNISHVQITGAVPDSIRGANISAFQSGSVDAMLFTYKAGGVGLDMSRADTLVRLQRSWSLIDNKQGEDRVHRIGSEIHDSVNIIDIITEETVEETQLLRLNDKLERLEEIVRDRQRRRELGQASADLDHREQEIMGTYLGDAVTAAISASNGGI